MLSVPRLSFKGDIDMSASLFHVSRVHYA
jgi:hypothetical protein